MANSSFIRLSERIRFEWRTWSLLAFVLALMEGGVLGVIIKNGFDSVAPKWQINIGVAVVTGAPYFANLLSFFWVKISHGRSKAKLVSDLALVFCFCCLLMAFIPVTTLGLFSFIFVVIVARLCWSGILTIRSTIWRVNYPRYIRGKVTAKLATLSALLMSLSALAVGWILDWQFGLYRWIYIVFSLLAVYGAFTYRQLAVRHQQRDIAREVQKGRPSSLKEKFSLLIQNRNFGRYMLAMFILGSGNLMFMAPLIVYLNEHSPLTPLAQILVTTAIPLALIPLAVGWWAKLLDGHHVFYFRSVHSWAFVLALTLFLSAQTLAYEVLFYVAAFAYGLAISGAVIGWNLGHNDFVGKGNPMDYMAIHVALTGLRGLVMPIIGVSLYQGLEHYSVGSGKYALMLPLLLSTLGAVLFIIFNNQYQREQ